MKAVNHPACASRRSTTVSPCSAVSREAVQTYHCEDRGTEEEVVCQDWGKVQPLVVAARRHVGQRESKKIRRLNTDIKFGRRRDRGSGERVGRGHGQKRRRRLGSAKNGMKAHAARVGRAPERKVHGKVMSIATPFHAKNDNFSGDCLFVLSA
jgi:hypothetical protein